MQAIEFSLPVAEVRELMPFEAVEVFPGMPVPDSPHHEATSDGWDPGVPAEACTELGCDPEVTPGSLTRVERSLTWLVGLGAASALVSFVMVILPG